MGLTRQALFWLAALLAVILLIALLNDILLPFVVGLVIAYFLNPLADLLEQKGLPRIWTSVLIVTAMALVFAALVVFVVPLLLAQAQQLAAALPGEFENFKNMLDSWGRANLGDRYADFAAGLERSLATLAENSGQLAGWLAGSLWTGGLAIVNFVALLLVTPVVVFYLLVDWQEMVAAIDRWLPRQHAPVLRRLAGDVDAAVGAFIRGQGTVCLILGLYYSIALSVAGLDYGLLVGIATGLMAFVPFVGWALGLITASALALVQAWPDPSLLIFVVAIFLGAQALDAGYLSPMIVGSKIGLHPVWLIFALFVFSYLFGLVGTLVAVPLAAAAGVLVRFALTSYLASSVYRGDSADNAIQSPTAKR